MDHKGDCPMSYMKRLIDLREGLEADLGRDGEAPSVLLLADVCDALGMEALDRRQVLGDAGAQLVDSWLGAPVALNVKETKGSAPPLMHSQSRS
jgi:hypothetical protein